MTKPLIGVGVPVWRGGCLRGRDIAVRAQPARCAVQAHRVDRRVRRGVPSACVSRSHPIQECISSCNRDDWDGSKTLRLCLPLRSKETEFVCVQPHDDWIEPDYLGTLLDMARKCPHAAVVYTDLIAFGAMHGITSQDSVTGTPMARQLSLLTRHYNSVAYRGLIFASALRVCRRYPATTVAILRATPFGWLDLRGPANSSACLRRSITRDTAQLPRMRRGRPGQRNRRLLPGPDTVSTCWPKR